MSSDFLSLNLKEPVEERPIDVATRGFAAGAAAGVASLVFAALLRFFLRLPLIPERVADAIFAVMPISIVEFGVALLGPYAKRFAFAGCVVGYVAIFALIGRVFAARKSNVTLPAGLLLGAGVWLASSLTLFPLLGGWFFGASWRPGPIAAPLGLLATGLVWGAAYAAIFRLFERNDRAARRGVSFASRRAVINSILTAGIGVVLWEGGKSVVAFFGWGGDARVSGGSGVFPDVDGLSREVTPTADFYYISKNVFDPEDVPVDWKLEVGGAVERPRSYTLDELRALPAAEGFATLMCISNWVGGDLIGNGYWKGVPMAAILQDAGVRAGAVDLLFTAFDDYTDTIRIDKALEPGTLLAYEMNGEPLNMTHGAPLRAIVPGIYGMKNVKWIRRIEVVEKDLKGYWQRRGWDDLALYQTMSRIDVARATRVGEPATIAGVAFAGNRGIASVEVSTDGGKTWRACELRAPLSENTWTLWQFAWTPERAGTYALVVRATDGTGSIQRPTRATPFPSGATGYHRVSVEAAAS